MWGILRVILIIYIDIYIYIYTISGLWLTGVGDRRKKGKKEMKEDEDAREMLGNSLTCAFVDPTMKRPSIVMKF